MEQTPSKPQNIKKFIPRKPKTVVSQDPTDEGRKREQGDQLERNKPFSLAKEKPRVNNPRRFIPFITRFLKRGQSSEGVETLKQTREAEEYHQDTPSRFRKRIALALFFFSVGIVVLFATQFLKFSQNGRTPESVPTPSPVSQNIPPSEIFFNPSVYATDEQVLKIEGDIKQLDQELSTVTLRETNLNLPSLNFDVNFEEK